MNLFTFMYPEFLWLLALIPIIALWRGRKGAEAAVEYSSTETLKHIGAVARGNAGAWLHALRYLALFFCIIALARPQLDRSQTEVQASGVDLMLALDVSGSMAALDLTLNGQPAPRVEVIKSVVSKFIEDRPNDRIGMVAFAGVPYLVSPPTLDHDWLLQNLDRVNIGMGEDGTAIGSAIAACLNRLRDQKSKSKSIILLTDGCNNMGKIAPLTAAEAAKAMGIKVYTIGAGTRGSAPIPVTDRFGRKVIQQMECDVDEGTLSKIAQITGGQFFRATDTKSLEETYAQIDKMEKTTQTMKRYEHFQEIFSWALLPGLCLLALEVGLAHTRFRRLP